MADAAAEAEAAAGVILIRWSVARGSAAGSQASVVKYPGDQIEDAAVVVLPTEMTAGAEGWLPCSRCRCRLFGSADVGEVLREDDDEYSGALVVLARAK